MTQPNPPTGSRGCHASHYKQSTFERSRHCVARLDRLVQHLILRSVYTAPRPASAESGVWQLARGPRGACKRRLRLHSPTLQVTIFLFCTSCQCELNAQPITGVRQLVELWIVRQVKVTNIAVRSACPMLECRSGGSCLCRIECALTARSRLVAPRTAPPTASCSGILPAGIEVKLTSKFPSIGFTCI